MKKLFLSFFLLLFSLNTFCQETGSIKISWYERFKNIPIILHESVYPIENGNTIKFETLKFYISNIQLFQNDVDVYSEPNSFHLIDVSDTSSQNIFLNPPHRINFNKIKFNLGIDSITNVSGVMGGDLDPTKGMYWAWQSGYVNFKMEGTSTACTPPKNDFEFHLGGYQYPFNSLQKIELKTSSKTNLKIILELNKFFTAIDLTTQKYIMSPCVDAVIFSKQLANCFSVK